MARKALVEKNSRIDTRSSLAKPARDTLKKLIMSKSTPMDQRFAAVQSLAKKPRNDSRVRVTLRCAISGRARGVYRRFGISRIALRDLGSIGEIPGLKKASW